MLKGVFHENKTSQHGYMQKTNNSTCKLPCASKYMPAMCGKKNKNAPKGGFPTMPYSRITILDFPINNSVKKI